MHLYAAVDGYKEGHEKIQKLDRMPLPSGGVMVIRELKLYDFTFPEEDLKFVCQNFQHNHIHMKEREIDKKAGKWLNNSYPFKSISYILLLILF